MLLSSFVEAININGGGVGHVIVFNADGRRVCG